MLKWILSKLATSLLSRWLLGGLVALLLGGGAWKWYDYKESLVQKGRQVCVQEITKETVSQLEDALAAEKSARADLAAKLNAAAAANQEARARRNELESRVASLSRQMAKQAETDETYKAWTDLPLPDGIAERLRNAQSGSDTSPLREDSN